MREIRIKIYDDISDLDAIMDVAKVIKMGRISQGKYCFGTMFIDGTEVHTEKYTKTDMFKVCKSRNGFDYGEE